MKKLLVLIGVLALVAAMVVPLAASAEQVSIGGSVAAVSSKITFVPPGTIDDTSWALSPWAGGNPLQVGLNYAHATDGSVTFVQGNDGVNGWKLGAVVKPGWFGPTSFAQMYASDWLPTPIKISFDGGSTFLQYNAADAPYTWNGPANATIPLYVEQQVNTTDKAGVYYIYIVYTLTPQ